MVNIFNTIKIDKLKLFYSKQDIGIADRRKIDNKIKKYFPQSTCFNQSGNIFYRFTPTKLVGLGREDFKHNLEMPSEEVLEKALKQITLNNTIIQERLRDTEIHLAKDLILDQGVNNCILDLANRHYSRLEAELIESNNGEYTLKLHGHHSIGSNESIKFTINIYNKSKQFFREHKTYICNLNHPLSHEDRCQVKDAYDAKNNTLDLGKLNWLRIEIQFVRTEKIKPIIKELSDTADFLTAKLLIDKLKDRSLYASLDNAFNKTLEKYIYNEKKETVKRGCSKIKQILYELPMENFDFYYFKTMAHELGAMEEFKEIFTELINCNSELYKELKDKIFETTQNHKNKYLARNTGNYQNRILSPINILYEVPILDDS